MIRTDKKFVKGDQIIIKGQVPNPFNESITVNLMYRALESNREFGEMIYYLNLTSKYSVSNAFVNGRWEPNDVLNLGLLILGTINNASNSVNLKGGERIRISITFTESNITPFVETERDIIQNTISYKCLDDYGIGLIEYIQVIGLKQIDGTELIKIKKLN
uniref:Uncharacterized protein n=1 Tax=Meloidogyne enterolobii TaxID=390850 RepID=A0A6V7XY92_MELEN|nr:unnamed protein product [Meloidogyne enterolobii]